MTARRFLIAQFCDDIRLEVGGKFSLMGCYAEELIVADLPALLPKLCAQVRVVTHSDAPFKRLVIRILFRDEVLGEIEFSPEQLETFAAKQIESRYPRGGLGVNMTFSPFSIEGEGQLRVEAETESELLLGSRLQIRAAKPSQSEPQLPTVASD